MTLTVEEVKRKARSQAYYRDSSTIYVPVMDHIYYNGLSYRVRVTNDNYRTSKNFKNIKEAIKFKNSLIKG